MNAILLLILHVLLYSSLGILFYKLRKYLSLIPFYLYLGSLEILVSLLNGVYSLNLGSNIVIGGGSIVYTAIIWSILLFYLMERDKELIMFIIYCLVIVQIFYALLYPFLFFILRNNLAVNPLNIPSTLFQTGWWIFIIGNFLQLLEAIAMIFLIGKFDKIALKIPWQLKSLLIFNFILIIDGILFPLLAFPAIKFISLASGLTGILVKIILGGLFSITLLVAMVVLKPSSEAKSAKDTSLLELIALPRAKIIKKYRTSEEKQKMIRLLLNLLSHDLRNYMTITLGRVNIALEESATLSDKQKEMLEAIKSLQYESHALVSSVLDLNKVQTTDLEMIPINLSEYVSLALDKVKQGYPDISIEIENMEVLRGVTINAHPLVLNVFTNIFTNSLKYRKKNQDNVVIDLDIKDEDDNVVLNIGDQGKGISEKAKKTVFKYVDEVHHKKELGLYIVSEILSDIGGKIEVNNRPESLDDYTKGTVFTLFFKK